MAWYEALHAPCRTEAESAAVDRDLALGDLFYLLTEILGRKDMVKDRKTAEWYFARCREVQADPDGHLDIWSREHGKSSIITNGLTIQDILVDPEVTFGIFSHTRPIAKGFLRQIKREFELNDRLKALFPDVLWANPRTEAPKWSEDEGIVVRRKGNPKEATVEAWGLVDGQPTSKHYKKRVYDDVVTRESVTTAEQIHKTTEAWELSDNLGTDGGIARYIGTRYALFDTYSVMMERKVVVPRIYPATDNGRIDGNPVLWSKEVWLGKAQLQASTLAAQCLCNPLAADQAMFQAKWLRGWEVRPRELSIFILADPSMGKNAESDRTGIAVIGMDAQSNKWLVDGYCHRMALSERWAAIKGLYQKWDRMPGVISIQVGYERYGMQSDLEYFEQQMRIERMRFPIREVSWVREGGQSKEARVGRLEPEIRLGRFRVPAVVWHEGFRDTRGHATWRCKRRRKEPDADGKLDPHGNEKPDELELLDEIEYLPLRADLSQIKRAKAEGLEYLTAKPLARRDEEGRGYDLTREFISQLLMFPVGKDKDLVDAASRVFDMELALPSGREASADPLGYGAEQLSPEPEVFVDGI